LHALWPHGRSGLGCAIVSARPIVQEPRDGRYVEWMEHVTDAQDVADVAAR
jgi:hypothetical protein